MLRLAVFTLAALVTASAGFVKTWTVEEIAAAPVLAVGRVTRISPKTHDNRCTADVTIVRPIQAVPSPVRLTFSCPDVLVNTVVPRPAEDRVYLLPLARAGMVWTFIGNQGHGLEIPVSAVQPRHETRASGKDFVLREYENTLLRGSYRELYDFGTYLRFQSFP